MTAITLIAFLTAGVVLARYHDPAARYRPAVSLIAATLAGGCFAGAAWVIATRGSSLGLLIVSLIAAAAALLTRGNVAKLLPCLKIQRWRSDP